MCWRITGKRRLVIAMFVLLAYGQVLAEDWNSGHHDIINGETYGEIWLYNDSTLDIRGGNIFRLATYDTTVTNWYDGQMNVLWTNGNSIINVYGGTLLNELVSVDDSLVNLYAYDVLITSTGGIRNNGQVTGEFLNNDISFAFDLWGQETYSHINIVPEPTTLLLLVFGSVFIKKKH